MNGVCSTHGRDDKCIHSFVQENLEGRGHMEDFGVDGKFVLKLGMQ
jgi:hypothetical protein